MATSPTSCRSASSIPTTRHRCRSPPPTTPRFTSWSTSAWNPTTATRRTRVGPSFAVRWSRPDPGGSCLLGLGDSPAPAAHFQHQRLRRRRTNRTFHFRHLLRGRLGRCGLGCARRIGCGDGFGRTGLFCLVLRGLQLVDQLRGFIGSEPPRGLALIEPHRSAGIPEVRVADALEQLQQLFHLAVRRCRTCTLTERHVAVWPLEPTAAGTGHS